LSVKIKISDLYIDIDSVLKKRRADKAKGSPSDLVEYNKGEEFGTAFITISGNGKEQTIYVDDINQEKEIDIDKFVNNDLVKITMVPNTGCGIATPVYDPHKVVGRYWGHVNYETSDERLKKVEDRLVNLSAKLYGMRLGNNV